MKWKWIGKKLATVSLKVLIFSFLQTRGLDVKVFAGNVGRTDRINLCEKDEYFFDISSSHFVYRISIRISKPDKPRQIIKKCRLHRR